MMMGGCHKKPNDPISGGIIDQSDSNAPKEIKSKDLVSLETGFFRYETDPAEGGYRYEFALKEEDGKVALSENKRYQISCEVDKEVLQKAQEIIEQFDLVKWNGQSRTTSGLPDEFAPYYLYAEYASGEKLGFYLDGYPDADWTKSFFKYFREVLAANGFAQALPPEASYVFSRFDFRYNEGDVIYSYGNILMPGKEEDFITCYHKLVWALDDSVHEDKFIMIPDGFFDKVKDLIEECNLYDFTNWSIQPPTFHYGDADFYTFCLETTDGRQFNGWYEGENIPPEMAEIKEKVKAFLDPVIEAGEEYTGHE